MKGDVGTMNDSTLTTNSDTMTKISNIVCINGALGTMSVGIGIMKGDVGTVTVDIGTTKGDIGRGREIFRKNCTACHRLENTGHEVGASLTAALRNKTRESLIIDILDPSREVDTRYVNYQVVTTAGRTITGILAVETPNSITLRRGENAEDSVLRTQIDEIRATAKSLMPEEFEKQITTAQLADLFEYLLGPGRSDPGK